MRAKKYFGQNFLKDKTVLTKIIETIPKNDNQIIEIGAGLGDLTSELVKYKKVISYEIDKSLLGHLKNRFKDELNSSRLELIFKDVLECWNDKKSLYDGEYDLIANLPYYISSKIVVSALKDANCKNIIVMLQDELADRFISEVGDKEFCSLSVVTKLLSEKAEKLFKVFPESFVPKPRVISAIVKISSRQAKTLSLEFEKFLLQSFKQPRKKLINNLSLAYDKNELEVIFAQLKIDNKVRANVISPKMYNQIYQRIINGREETNTK